MSDETFKYLKKILYEEWPDSLTGDNIVQIKMGLYVDFMMYHSKKSTIDKEFSLLLDLKEIDMNIYKPN